MQTRTISIDEVTTFPTDIRNPHTGTWIRLVGYKRPHKHLSGVYAYVDPETNEYEGMIMAQDGMMDAPATVEVRS